MTAAGTGFFVPTGVRAAAGLLAALVAGVFAAGVLPLAGVFAAAGTGFFVGAEAVAGFAALPAVFEAAEAGVPALAGFFTGVFAGVLAAGFASPGGSAYVSTTSIASSYPTLAAGALAAGAFLGDSLSTRLIFCIPASSISQRSTQ